MKKSKTSSEKIKRPNQMTKEELIATLVKKKQCNAKALSIVELMVEREVNTQWLLDSLQFISQSHYQDAVEERAIMKICGYPLCQNALGNIPKQQYRISTQNNKVYDISERKNFCGNACYRSSSFLKDQIMTSPLWLRDIDKVPEYKLLDSGSIRGGLGDEIDVGPTRVPLEDALNNHDSPRNTEDQTQGGSNNENPLSKSRESTLGVSGYNHLEESSSASKNEHGLPMDEEKKVAAPSYDVSEDDKQACSRSVETTSNEPKEILLTVDKLVETIKSSDISEQVETCSDTNVSEKTSGTDIMKTSVKMEENDSSINLKVTETIVCDSSIPKSSAVLADSVKEQRYPKPAENSFEKSNATETDDSKQMKERDNHKAKVRREKQTSKPAKVSPVVMPCISEVIEERLKEWFTVDSLCFLYGEQRVREMLGQQGGDLEQNFKPLDSATWDPEKHNRFVKMCKRLDLVDLLDRSNDEKIINEDKKVVKKPLPDYNKLKEEAKNLELRVQAFYSNCPSFELEPKKVTFAEDTKEDPEDQDLPVIPLVHQHEQRALRRRLVLDALNRVLPDLLRTIGVQTSQVNSALRGLVGTFALSANNITFNPRQWTLMAIAIIKMLSLREVRLQHALASEASQKYLTLIQMSYNLSPTFLDLLIDRLVSIVLSLKLSEIS